MSSQETKMSTKVVLSCSNGNSLIGAHDLTCLPSGNWSAPMPVCESVRACAYPGTVISGSISSVKFYYQIGETVEFNCDEGKRLVGASKIRCLKTAKWSSAMPSCS
ncbi:unnamed protein product [Nesidiocoris tenuis]|uniref:Sushi domain-containing protein n=1 Tax=Nesidiocoris tenuis TaxID=355587 RepID=A0A6H5FVD2_9HEMI|nr:unnamed protein product [Nesidiocoris tenuis]